MLQAPTFTTGKTSTSDSILKGINLCTIHPEVNMSVEPDVFTIHTRTNTLFTGKLFYVYPGEDSSTRSVFSIQNSS